MTYEDIDLLYKSRGYFEYYSPSIISAIVFFILFFIFLFYNYALFFYYSKKTSAEKCDPATMLFNMDSSAVFQECVNANLSGIVDKEINIPVTVVSSQIRKVEKANTESVKAVDKHINIIKNNMKTNLKKVFHKLIGVLIPTQIILKKIKDTWHKSLSVILTGAYSLYGFLIHLKATMKYFLAVLVASLITMASRLASQFMLPMMTGTAQAGLNYLVLLAIPTAVLIHWFEIIFANNKNLYTLPQNPRCFDKNVLIETRNGYKRIKDLKVGTRLVNREKVTAVLKLSFSGETMFDLYGIKVTGSHNVFSTTLGWIPVYKHPDAKKIKYYGERFVYCINTTNKRIKINNTLFLDWDDITDADLYKLKKQTSVTRYSEIHAMLDVGFSGDTLIAMRNGGRRLIKDIQINDRLKYGERVIGIVRIEPKKMKCRQFKHFDLIGKINLGKNAACAMPEELYHLITNKCGFYIGKEFFGDYNSIMEKYDYGEKLSIWNV